MKSILLFSRLLSVAILVLVPVFLIWLIAQAASSQLGNPETYNFTQSSTSRVVYVTTFPDVGTRAYFADGSYKSYTIPLIEWEERGMMRTHQSFAVNPSYSCFDRQSNQVRTRLKPDIPVGKVFKHFIRKNLTHCHINENEIR